MVVCRVPSGSMRIRQRPWVRGVWSARQINAVLSRSVGQAEGFIAKAVEAALRNRDLDDLVGRLVDEIGPIPPELAAEADAARRAS